MIKQIIYKSEYIQINSKEEFHAKSKKKKNHNFEKRFIFRMT